MSPGRYKAKSSLSMDFIFDQLSFGRRVKKLTVVDVFLKFNHTLEFDYGTNGVRVIQILKNVCDFGTKPEIITVNNSPEFICVALEEHNTGKACGSLGVNKNMKIDQD